ncbi:hypothetical protein BpHYR1_028749 [Brachionus plicatilis]|uniref:Uncharacterized protein n=1 Tax=Brachionus plicatilis TaxID=10195 RepID=A0A3M7RS73_BRAPC|nr:hypothetical protein BpHYR1_028749 [Brachionus plicatilis]
MLNSATTASLRSLNEINARPKRTSYGEMSTWFFMDEKELNSDIGKSYVDLNDFQDKSCYHFEELTLPALVTKNEVIKKSPKREVPASPIVREFLMRNWSEKRSDMNKKSKEKNQENRKGRSGAGGVWPNITQAFRENGNRLLFVEGPTYNRVPFNSQENLNSNSQLEKPQLTKAILEKMDRERLGVQTRYGTENGNWSIFR